MPNISILKHKDAKTKTEFVRKHHERESKPKVK